MQEFFPLNRSMFEESEEFRGLTHLEKVFFINLVADMNAALPDDGEFYRADAKYAAALNVSIRKIRQARFKFKRLDLIDYRSGGIARNRPLATRYLRVEWARTPKEGEGDQFAKMQRYAFNMILARLRRGDFKAEDIVCYAYLVWWREKYPQNETFVLFKNQFSRMTGIKNVGECVRRLYENFEYDGGDRLFEFKDRHQKIVLWKLSSPADPSKDEGNVEIAESYRQEIDEKAECLSQDGKKDWSGRQRKAKPQTVSRKRKRRKTRWGNGVPPSVDPETGEIKDEQKKYPVSKAHSQLEGAERIMSNPGQINEVACELFPETEFEDWRDLAEENKTALLAELIALTQSGR